MSYQIITGQSVKAVLFSLLILTCSFALAEEPNQEPALVFTFEDPQPWHLPVQQGAPELWQRQARLDQLDDAAEPSGEPGGSSSGDFPGLMRGTFFSLGVA